MESFVVTRAAQNKINPEKLHVVTIHEARKKVSNSFNNQRIGKKSKLNDGSRNVDNDDDDDNDDGDDRAGERITSTKDENKPNMNRLRHEIIKFGMTGFEKKKSVKAKIALAVSLGAKPPKNRYKNYKKLVEQKKREKLREEKKKKVSSGFQPTQLKMNMKKDAKQNNGDKSSRNHKNTKFAKHKNFKKADGILGIYGKVNK